MNLLEKWFRRKSPKDPRRGKRRERPQLVAHYWTGAAPHAVGVCNISSSGMYLQTEERWYPGTVVKITLQRTGETEETQGHLIVVYSRVVRQDADGVGLEFVLAQKTPRRLEQSAQDVVADQESMDRFVARLFEEESMVFLEVDLAISPGGEQGIEAKIYDSGKQGQQKTKG